MPEMVTPDELALINQRFAKEPLTGAYCIPMLAADTQRVIDSRALKLDASTIAKYAKDANERGPNLQLAHASFMQPIPLGKVFAGTDANGQLFTKAYMPVGMSIPNLLGGTVNTTDVANAYAAGLADRVSIGFSFERAECNICFNDVRSPDCPHMPGQIVEGDSGPLECTPVIFAGDKGTLQEISLVWQGALDNAKTVKRTDLPTGFAEGGRVEELFALRKSHTLPEVGVGHLTLSLLNQEHPAVSTETTAPEVGIGHFSNDYQVGDLIELFPNVMPQTDDFALTHNSTLAKSEPAWGGVDKTKLPRNAFADEGQAGMKSSWGYPHHWVQNGGGVNDIGCFTTGDMFLHRGGLRAALAAAGGARSGQDASAAVKAHLDAHAKAIGMGQNQLAVIGEWMFAPEWFEHPILDPVFDRLTEEEWKAFGDAIDSETVRLTDETVALAIEQAVHRKDLEQRLETQAVNIDGLLKRIEALTKMADLGTQYCDTVKAKALNVGVKCMGNAFKADFYTQVFSEALEKGEVGVVTAAIEAWESEFQAKVPVGRQTSEPAPSQNGMRIGHETPVEQFARLVQDELTTNGWGDNRYGDAVRAVSRRHPTLLQA